MTDHLGWETLNDLVDGVLDSRAAAAAEHHARGCRSCGLALSELRATVALAHELPNTVMPPDELWNDVRATIEARKVAEFPSAPGARPRGWWMTPGRVAAAAVMLVAATASVTGLMMRSGPPAGEVAAIPSVSTSWQVAERVFQASVLELRQELATLHAHLSPETLVKVEQALATIDLAIAEGREALLRDPANTALSELVASNYRQKIELLRRMTQLASST